jgi:hypothetical protein
MAAMPGRNFARFVLILFVLSCLVVRTGYQGVQYNLMLKVKLNFHNLQSLPSSNIPGNQT